MTLYTNFIGIDIGKFNFVASIYGLKTTTDYTNSIDGIKQFIEDNRKLLPSSLCVVETTGGYELELIYSLVGYSFTDS